MTIVKQTLNLLILRSLPIWKWILGSVCMSGGLYIFATFVPLFIHSLTNPINNPINNLLLLFGLALVICIWGVTFIFLGGNILLEAPITTCVFDKILNSFTLKSQRLLHTKVIERRLDGIRNVFVNEIKPIDEKENVQYQATIVLVEGFKLPLTGFSSENWKRQQEITLCIEKFLSSGTNSTFNPKSIISPSWERRY